MAEYKLTFSPDPIVIDNLPLSNWTIVNTNTLSINGDTITQLGVGGWYESMFVSFTVPETGSYKISYDYNITNAKVGNHGTYGFGLWLTTNNPNVSGDAQSSFYNNANNRTGFIIGVQNENISGKHGTASFNANLTAGTTYYLWYPGAALDDGTTFTLSFTNIRVYNNPIQYTYNNILTYPNWNGYLEYSYIHTSASLYKFEGEYTGNVFGTTDVSNAPYDYVAIKFDYRNTAPSYGAGGWQISFNNASWRTRYRHGQGNHTLLKQQPYSYVNTATVGWYNVDRTNNYYSKLYNCTDYHPIKLLCNKNVGDVSSFVENIYHGHQELNVSLTSLTFTQYNESSVSHTAKNVEIASFNTLEEAVNWS